MAPRKPSSTVEPILNRMQTRPKNATTHPGRIINETMVVRRTAEEIENEKNAKEERRQARKQKKANLETAAVEIAEFENKMAVGEAEELSKFPRSKPNLKDTNPFELEANGKKRGKTTSSSSGAGRDKETGKSTAKLSKKQIETTSDLDPTESELTEVEETEGDEPKAKRLKTSNKEKFRIRPTLRRTETFIVASSENSDIEMRSVPTFSRVEREMDEVKTPMPKKKAVKRKDDDYGTELEGDSESDNFQTPKALKKAVAKRAELLAESDANSVDMVNADTQTDGRTESESEDARKQQNKFEGPKGKKDKRAFRKDVKEKRELAKSTTVATVARVTPSPQRNRRIASKSQTHNVNSKSGKITSSTKSSTAQEPEGTRFRTSATSSNNVGVSQITSAVNSKQKKSKSAEAQEKFNNGSGDSEVEITSATGNFKDGESKFKPKSALAVVENSGGLSNEDDSVERESILKSPPKGGKRLSSAVVVNVVDKPRSVSNKSRSKENILGSHAIVSGWSKSVEPIFIYFYFYDLSPWPTTADIATCVQPIWNWRFGDAHPLRLAENPQHLQLLNQKLCDIRNQAALMALGYVDEAFHTDTNVSELTQKQIVDLRGQYAKDCLDDKKFVFGKYTVSDDGKARKTLPYQNKVILQTFACFFKHIKDTNLGHGGDSPLSSLPEPHHPKAALAIATTAVERALTLCIHGDYDFTTNKLIPKPDPSHPTKRPSTNMFAFSESSWKGRAEFYIEKGISKLKEKDWENIMKGVAEYSTFVAKSMRSSQKASQLTEEELEMDWESDSEADLAK